MKGESVPYHYIRNADRLWLSSAVHRLYDVFGIVEYYVGDGDGISHHVHDDASLPDAELPRSIRQPAASHAKLFGLFVSTENMEL